MTSCVSKLQAAGRTMQRACQPHWISLVLLVLIGNAGAAERLAITANASGNRLWVVTNSGLDSVSCGSYASPCRSISQAIANASDGDQIAVGIGKYGDVSGTASFSGPGDERPGSMYSQFSPGCVICIHKALQITSFAGAAETVIQGNLAASQNTAVVGIENDGVTFGTPGHGFTITGGKFGVVISEGCMTKSVSVAGNVDLNDSVGFGLFGIYGGDPPGCPVANVQISNNSALNNAKGGFVMVLNGLAGPVVVQKNLAMGSSGAGFDVSPGVLGGDPVFWAGNVTLLSNVAISNYYGFSLAQIGKAQYNTASNNTAAGFSLVGDVDPLHGKLFTVFSYNAAVGNRGPGAIVYELDLGTASYISGFADVSHNDFIGNDRNRTVTAPISGLNIGASAHCGILNTGYSPAFGRAVGGKLQSLQDFWGIPQGPQASGAADNAGGVCDKNGAVTKVTPFSTSAWVFTSLQLSVQ